MGPKRVTAQIIRAISETLEPAEQNTLKTTMRSSGMTIAELAARAVDDEEQQTDLLEVTEELFPKLYIKLLAILEISGNPSPSDPDPLLPDSDYAEYWAKDSTDYERMAESWNAVQAVDILKTSAIVVVIGSNGKLVGTVTPRDIEESSHKLEEVNVSKVMKEKPKTVKGHMLMEEIDFSQWRPYPVPVVNDNMECIGVITEMEIVSWKKQRE